MEFFRSQPTKFHQDVIAKGFYGGGMSSKPEDQARSLFKYYLSLDSKCLNSKLFDLNVINARAKEFWQDLFKTHEDPVWEAKPFFNKTLNKWTKTRVKSKTQTKTTHMVRDLSAKILYYGRNARSGCPFVSTGMKPDVKVATSTTDTLYRIEMELQLYAILENGVLSEAKDGKFAQGCKCALALDEMNLDSAQHIVYIHAFTGGDHTTGEATFFTKIPPTCIQYRKGKDWADV